MATRELHLPARPRVGVLTNPTAQYNHRFPGTHLALEAELESQTDCVLTANKREIPSAIEYLWFRRRVEVLAINGGDGTIHGALNAMVRLMEGREDTPPVPLLLLLNGGTYNMASRAMGTKGNPVNAVSRFLRACERLEDRCWLNVARLRLLLIRPEGSDPMVGMVFGSEVVANALELCDRLGSGYPGLARLLGQGCAGMLFRGRFLEQNQWRLVPRERWCRLDGRELADATAAVASTIDLKLLKGLIWSLRVDPGSAGFHCKVVRTHSEKQLLALLPYLLFELSHTLIHVDKATRKLEVAGGFTVDGELYQHEGRVEVGLSPYTFDVLKGDNF